MVSFDYRQVLITNIHFGDPKKGAEKEIFVEVSSAATGQVCLKASLASAMSVIEKNDFKILNEVEAIDLINIMYNIDYSRLSKYDKISRGINKR